MLIFYIATILSVLNLLTRKKIFSYLIFFLLIFIGACRNITIGTDTGTWYYKNWVFTTLASKTWNHFTPFEPGFNLLIGIFKEYVSSSYIFFYSSLFLITYILFIFYLKKEELDLGIGLSLFLLTGNYLFCMNIMRQMLALSMAIILVSKFLKKNNYTQYIIGIILISIFFHKSIIILLLIPIFKISNVEYWLNTKVLFILWIIFLFLSMNISLINNIYPYIQLLMNNTSYERHINTLMEYGEQERTVGYIGSSILILSLLKLSEGQRNIYFYVGYVGLLFSMLSKSIMPEFGRIFINICFFIVPYLTTIYQNKNSSKNIYITYILIAYLAFSFISSLKISSFVPYKTFFD